MAILDKFRRFKQPKKSKEVRQEEKRQRAIVREQFYPFLKENAKTVGEARNMLLMFSTAIQSKFDTETLRKREEMSTGLLSEMGVDMLIIDKTAPEMKLLEILGDETVATAKGLIDGMAKAIDETIKGQTNGKSLDELPLEDQFL